MTKAEVSKHTAEMVLPEKAREVIGKKRKQRSDKGVKKGSRAGQGVNDVEDSSDNGDNGEEAGPLKKKKMAPQTKPTTKGKVKQASHKTGKKKKTTLKGKGRSSKSQLPRSKLVITDTDDESGDGSMTE